MPRVWTLDEANAALGQVRRLLKEARVHLGALRDAQAHVDDLRIVYGESLGDPEQGGQADLDRHAAALGAAKAGLGECLMRFRGMGVDVKDLDAGLVDFPTRLGDRVVLLCWREGEDTVGHWHSLDGGFAGRQPVPRFEGVDGPG